MKAPVGAPPESRIMTLALQSLFDQVAAVGGYIPCTSDPDLWFADEPADIERAKVLCHRCPIRRECLAGAIERAEPWGVWGGQLIHGGRVIPRKRPRGRPRKATGEIAASAPVAGSRKERDRCAH